MPHFNEIQLALERCLRAEPPTAAPFYELSSDSSLLADIFGEMLFHGEQSKDLDQLTSKQREAFVRWSQQQFAAELPVRDSK